MSARHWQWKYGDGRGVGFGVWPLSPDDANTDNGEAAPLIAHYGGVTRPIRYFGQPAFALQCLDVMVADAGRGSLTRRGPLFLATAACLERYIGYDTPHLVGFGFPNQRAFRLPERLGLYTSVGRMFEARWLALRTRPGFRESVRPLTLSMTDTGVRRLASAAASMVNRCWTAMEACLGQYIVGVRDTAYVEHRYLQHPDFDYRLYVVQSRWGNEVLGVLVLRIQTKETTTAPPVCELVDVIGPPEHWPKLLYQARRLAAGMGCSHLLAWLSDGLLQALANQTRSLHGRATPNDEILTATFDKPFGACNLTTLDVSIPANVWSPGPNAAEQRGRWWLMGGDTDFR